MHEVLAMNFHTDDINVIMKNFFYKEIKCSSCLRLGMTSAVLYDIPQYLLLSHINNNLQCVNLLYDVDLLVIQPSSDDSKFEYSPNIALFLLDNDEIFYIRKVDARLSYYNKNNGHFEMFDDITSQYVGLGSRWTIYIYETQADIFSIPSLKKTLIDQTKLQPSNEPEVWSIGTVQGLLPSFKTSFEIGNVLMGLNDIELLLNEDGDLNDLIIDGCLSLIASTAPTHKRVLAVQNYIVLQIIEKRIKRFNKKWLDFDIILCPIVQYHHWYLIIIDFKEKLVLEFDSMPNNTLPKRQNMNRLLKYLDIQYYFHHKTNIDFINDWQRVTPIEDFNLKQQDIHSCGVHLLVHAHAYTQQHKFAHITSDNVRLYRFQIAEFILRNALPTRTDSDSSVSEILNILILSSIHFF